MFCLGPQRRQLPCGMPVAPACGNSSRDYSHAARLADAEQMRGLSSSTTGRYNSCTPYITTANQVWSYQHGTYHLFHAVDEACFI